LAAHAAEAPFVVNEGIDEEALVGIGGAVVFVVFGAQFGEIAGGFVEHDLVFGVEPCLRALKRDAVWPWGVRGLANSIELARPAAACLGVDIGGTSI
jgi:hypothetical protein